MGKACGFAMGVCAAGVMACAVGMATWAVVHRRVIAAVMKGEPVPEPPAWHVGHACLNKQ